VYCHGPGGSFTDGLRARWKLAVAPRDEERGEVADVIGVEVRQHDVRDRGPVDAEGRHPMHDAAAAVEEHPRGPRLDEVPRVHAPRIGCRGAGA
jgi:hypothetical protein